MTVSVRARSQDLRGTSREPSSLPVTAVASLLATIVFFPVLVATIVPVRVAIVAVGLLALTVEAWRQSRFRAYAIVIAVSGTVYTVAVLWVASVLARGASDAAVAMNLQRLLVVFPLFGALGAILFRSRQRSTWLKPFVLAGLVSSAFAAFESIRGAPIFQVAETFARYQRGGEGAIRGVGGAEHVLVLGVLLTALIPLVRKSRLPAPNLIATTLLAGVYFTGSRGPLIIATGLLFVQASPKLVERLGKSARGIRAILLAALVAVIILGLFVWKAESTGRTGLAYSTEYRFAIYALLPKILASVPWGLGPRSIPAGEWLFDSQLRGVRDLAITVDSELVYLVLAFGWFGIILFAAAFAVSSSALRYAPEIALGTLAISLSGYFIALHAWDTLGPMWYLLLGASMASVAIGRHAARLGRRGTESGGAASRLRDPRPRNGLRSSQEGRRARRNEGSQ